MDTFFNKQVPNNMPPLAATIGMFDGVHRGHRLVVDHLRQAASARGLKTAVFTFPNHPQLLFPRLRSAAAHKPGKEGFAAGADGR